MGANREQKKMPELLDTPLTRQKKKYDDLLSKKDQEIAELKIQIAKVRGVNDLLKFELIGLELTVENMKKNLDEAISHIQSLKKNLPDLEKFN